MTRPPRSSTLESAAARYLNGRRGRAAFSGPPAIGRAAGKVIKPLSARFGPGIDSLSENWTEIVGERLAAWSAPEAVRGNVLFITAKGPAAAIIEAEAARILERVGNFAGQRAPTRIQVRQGTLRKMDKRTPISREIKPDLHKKLETKGADRLSSALERFDRAVRGKTETGE
tara:strand:+ start:2369 stop:2884 length:516 start_codon:yes stop_codon:yes gene_type:complete